MTKLDWSAATRADVDADAFASLVAAVATQADYATFEFAPDGALSVTACSPDHVTMVRAAMPPGSFSAQLPARLTFRLSHLADALKGLRGPAVVEHIPGRVRIGGGGFRTVVPLESREELPRFPDLAMSATAILSPVPLSALISKAGKEVGAVRIAIGPDGLSADTLDDEGLGSSVDIPADACAFIEGTASAAYPVKPWAEILRAVPKDADVSVEFDSSYPVRVSYDGSGWSMSWLCAPRIEEEDL